MTKGFTLIEMCFCMMISSFLILLILLDCKVFNQIKIEPSDYSDLVIGTKQISQELMQAKDIQVSQDQIQYTTKDNTFIISLKNNVVVKEPGYVVIFYGIDTLSFQQSDLIEIDLERKDEEYHFYIGICNE